MGRDPSYQPSSAGVVVILAVVIDGVVGEEAGFPIAVVVEEDRNREVGDEEGTWFGTTMKEDEDVVMSGEVSDAAAFPFLLWKPR